MGGTSVSMCGSTAEAYMEDSWMTARPITTSLWFAQVAMDTLDRRMQSAQRNAI